MATVETSPAPKKRLGWLRLLGWIFGILSVLVVALYFIVTSSAFFTGFILPRASKALNAEISVSDASISPFSQVVLHNLKVQTTGTEPLVTAAEVRLRYSLTAILGGNIQVDEITLASPTVALITNPDGTSNLDPLTKSQKSAEAKPAETQSPPAAKSSKPVQVDLKKLALTDATIRTVKLYAGGTKDVTEVSHLNLTVENVKNGQTGKITVGAAVAVNNNPPIVANAGSLDARLSGGYDFTLTPALMPASVKGSVRLEVAGAKGAFAPAAALIADLNCDLSATEIKQVGLQFNQGAAPLGRISVSGPFDMNSMEGRLAVQVANIDKNLLNLATAGMGLSFGDTTINSTNEIVLAKAASQITATGQLNLKDLQVSRAGQTMPSVGLQATYGVAVDRAAGNIVLSTFSLNATQSGKTVLQAGLSSPMTLAMSGSGATVGDSKLNLAIDHLSLADWRPFLNDASLAGDVSLALQLLSQQGGKKNTIDFSSQIGNLTAGAGSLHITQLSIRSLLNHSSPDFKQHTLKGSFGLSDFSGQFGANSLTNFGTTVSLDIVSSPTQVLFNKVSAQLTQGGKAGGSFELGGSLTLATKAAQLTAKLSDLNQNLLRSFLEPALSGKKLGSVAINANVAAQYDPQAASTLKGGLEITNLIVNDPGQQIPATPLAVALQIDGAFNHQVLDLKNLQVALTPTARGTNVVQLSGQVDLSKTNVQGNLKLAADSIDVTGYYDLFMSTNATKSPAATPGSTGAKGATPGSPAANPNQEPAAMHFPVRNFTAELDVRRFYLREIDIAGLQGTARIDDSHLVLNPFKLTLNGAPISTMLDLDLGVPGFRYDVVFNAAAVPLAPLVNSFLPERRGIVAGTFSAQAKVTGAGITGASLQTNLTGQFDMGSTNLNLASTNMPTKTLKLVVAAVAEIPSLVQNAGGVGGGLLKNALGLGSSTNVDLSRSVIDSIVAKGTLGSGKISVAQLLIQSPGFQALAPTTVTLAPVLTNSTLEIPVSVALERSIAQRCYLASSGSNGTYVQLPPFLTMTGTIGNPQKHMETAALLKFALQQVAAQGAGGKGAAGQVLQGVNSLLGGSSSTNSAGTNSATGKAGSLLNNLLGGANSATNKAATNQSPVNNLLKGFFK